jgi:hypothetical protein
MKLICNQWNHRLFVALYLYSVGTNSSVASPKEVLVDPSGRPLTNPTTMIVRKWDTSLKVCVTMICCDSFIHMFMSIESRICSCIWPRMDCTIHRLLYVSISIPLPSLNNHYLCLAHASY